MLIHSPPPPPLPPSSIERDLPLLNLANILHRSHHSSEAATALRIALSHAPDVSVLHFTLGNVYAVSDPLP